MKIFFASIYGKIALLLLSFFFINSFFGYGCGGSSYKKSKITRGKVPLIIASPVSPYSSSSGGRSGGGWSSK